LFSRSVLGMDRDTALWGVDAAEVVLQQWAHYERESGKAVNWGAGQSVLDRVTVILNRELANGANA
jgi:hypothetical protein